MAAPMHKITFQYKKVQFTLALEESIVTKLKDDADYIKELFNFLIEQGTLRDKGVPTDADVADIKVVDEGIIPIFAQEEPSATNTATNNTMQANLDKEKALWTDAMTQLVISARLKRDADFDKPIRKRKLWENIAQIMQENGYQVTGDDCDTKWRNVLSTYKKNKERAVAFGEEVVNWKYYFTMNNVLGDKVHITPVSKSLPSPPHHYSDSDEYASSPTSESFSRGRSARRPTKRCSCTSMSSHPSKSESTSLSKYDSTFQLKRDYDKVYKFKRRRLAEVNENTHASDEGAAPLEVPATNEAPVWFVKYLKEKKVADQLREEKEEKRWKEHAELEKKKVEAMYALIDALKPK